MFININFANSKSITANVNISSVEKFECAIHIYNM